jgi:Protein of unknown function (DUF3187)
MELDCLSGMKALRTLCRLASWRRSLRRFRGGAPAGQPEGPSLRKGVLLLTAAVLLLGIALPVQAADDNGGLGMLPIGDEFPIKLKFLIFAPERVQALPAGVVDVSYQFSVANTIVNTQFNPQNGSPKIAQSQVNAGLTSANFPSTGYGEYIRAETDRNLFRFRVGIGGGVELGLDQAWVSFGGGALDSTIGEVEGGFNGENPERRGFATNQFHYYVYNNGRALTATSTSVYNVPQDPVASLKWNLTGGGDILPAISIKFAYKAALDSAKSPERSLVSSGHDDSGYSVMLSKEIGKWVAHLQIGETFIGGGDTDYVSTLRHQIFGLEYRIDSRNSLVAQTSNETSVLNVGTVSATSADFATSRPADVLSAGFEHAGKVFHWDLGFSEDYISRDNTTDIVLFFDLGWKW